MKHLCTALATALAAAFCASAKTFDWPIDAPTAGARQFTAYHGETVRFNLRLGGAMTNLSPVAIYYQTNGMGKAEWFGPIPGTVFGPTNDCGAAFYRFFIRCTDPDGINYTANGSLRMLDSPGFVPNEVPFPARRIDFSQVEVLNPPWPSVSAVETVASNAAVAATAPLFRPFGDEYVYESTGMGDFTWSSDRADILAALGTTQPYLGYEYENYGEWHLDFSVGATNYWGYAYAPLNSPEVEFYVDGYFWDDSTGDEHYDYATVVGSRAPGGYNRANPVDTFAHQSDITAINASVSLVKSYIDGETKVLRTGEPGQLGTGWGYISHSITNDHRRWRFRVPKWNVASAMASSSGSLTRYYRTVDDPSNQDTGFGTEYGGFLSALPSRFPQCALSRRVLETRGIYGTDACQFADYAVGLWSLSEDGTGGDSACAARYSVVHTSTSPMRFLTTLLTNELHSSLFEIPVAVSGGTVPGYFRLVDLPPVTNTVIRNYTYTGYTYYNLYEKGTGTVVAVLKAVGVVPSMIGTTPVSSDNTIPLKLSFISDQRCDETHVRYTTAKGTPAQHTPYTNHYVHAVSVTNMLTTMSISIPCDSATTFEDVTADYYKLLSTLDADRHLYYDSAAGVSYRVVVSNGCFFAEKIMDGDWRRGGL
ncbi:MAG: hypothetical protein IJG84_21315 [Kiritimatiellae bacterium]|nr:hypothetical protein [Kiritimatiellia bacterium]